MALDNLPTLTRHCVQYLTGHLFSVIVIFMVSGVDDLEKKLSRSRIAIFAILGFLVLITYLLISVSQSVRNQAVTTGSEASTEFGYQSALQIMKQMQGNRTTTVSTGNMEGNQNSQTQGEPTISCPATVTMQADSQISGGCYSRATVTCGNGPGKIYSSSSQGASCLSQERWQAAADTLCGCTTVPVVPPPDNPPTNCSATWKPWEDTKCSFGGDACYSNVVVKCQPSGEEYNVDFGWCADTDFWNKESTDMCCDGDTCGSWGPGNRVRCDVRCQEKRGRDCVPGGLYPGDYTCDGNDPVLCPAP